MGTPYATLVPEPPARVRRGTQGAAPRPIANQGFVETLRRGLQDPPYLRRLGDRGLLQHEIVVHLIERAFERLAVRRLAAGDLLEIDDERFLHTVHHVVVDITIAAPEQMGDDAVVAGRLDHEMDVRRPVMADVRALDQLADGADRKSVV